MSENLGLLQYVSMEKLYAYQMLTCTSDTEIVLQSVMVFACTCTTETQIVLQSITALKQHASMYYCNTDCFAEYNYLNNMQACTPETQIVLQSVTVLGQDASMYCCNTDCFAEYNCT